jgi:hypothetical protein
MPLVVRLCLVPLILGCSLLAAEEPEKKEPVREWCHHSSFGAEIQTNWPARELKDELDRRVGYGVGLQWVHEHGEYHARRTRVEFNVFPEGNPVGPTGVKTYAKNHLISFDHLFRVTGSLQGPYLVAGVGGAHWVLDQSTTGPTNRLSTNKLVFAGGIGMQLSPRVNLEARYTLSGIQKTFDANTTQLSLGWQF